MNKIIAIKQETLTSKDSLIATTKLKISTWSDLAIENYLFESITQNNISGFPSSLHEELKGYVAVYQTALNSKNKDLIQGTETLIRIYAEEVGVWKLRDLMGKDGVYSSPRLQHMCEKLEGVHYQIPMVKMTIKAGKVLWQFMLGDEPIKDAQGKPVQNGHPILETAKSLRLTLDQFVKFKNAGKRYSNVTITEARYNEAVEHVRKNSPLKACFTKLKLPSHHDLVTNGVLDPKNRLAYSFRQLSSETIKISYPYSTKRADQADFLTQVLQHCVTHAAWGKRNEFVLDGPQELNRTRLEKSPKKIAGTGRVTFVSESSQPVSKWDAGTYKELCAFKRVGDLEYDHIPSQSTVKSIFKTTKRTESAQNVKEQSLCLAVETQLHKTGATHGTVDPDANTYQNLGPPMLKDIRTHLENLEKKGQLSIEAIGSMRTLYHLNVKYRFPESQSVELDTLLLNYLEKLLK